MPHTLNFAVRPDPGCKSPGSQSLQGYLLQSGFSLIAGFFLLLLVFLPDHLNAATSTAASADVNNEQVIMILGDSIGAAYGLDEADGWVNLLQQALESTQPGVQVINTSISGDTTDGGLQRLPAALDRFNPDIVLLELGGNDGLRGQSLKRMQQNLTAMVELIQEQGATAVLLGMRIPPNYGVTYTERFHAIYEDVANNTGAALVPFLLAGIAHERSYFQPDGIHPTAKAQPLLLQEVLPVVEEIVTADTDHQETTD
ncbi:MAG: arylesterase [Gammaproteobacteria bacterium]|nr:arylesterase [Gammaproteobacteria bacterium]